MKYYIKALLKNMKSRHDGFQYKMGVNKHAAPDKSDELCSRGFHLAYTIGASVDYVPHAKKFYLCTARKVYARDDDKLRCGEVNILWQIPTRLINIYWVNRNALADRCRADPKTQADRYWAGRRKLEQTTMKTIIKEWEVLACGS